MAANDNVFLGGHSAGTGFTARYAATDFNLTGVGPAEPGYAKLRGLVLLEGGGGSTGGAPLTADTLDRIEAKFDGGLFGAVRDNAARCVDGTTACTIANEATTASARCRRSARLATTCVRRPACSTRASSPPPRSSAIQAINDPDTGANLLSVDQGAPGNNAVAQVPDLGSLTSSRPRRRRAGSAASSTTTASSPVSRPSSPCPSAPPAR